MKKKKIIALCYLKIDHFEPVNENSDTNFTILSPQFIDISSDLLAANKKYIPPIQDLDIEPANLKGKKKYEYWVSKLKRGVQIMRNNITLKINDLDDLVHRELTSSIINFYLKLLEDKIKDKKYYIFNTFFFTELIKDSKNIELAAVNSWAQYKGQELNLFEYDRIFVPIHRKEKFNWVLAIINLKEKRFEYCDSANYQDNFFSSIARPALQFYMEHKQRQHILKPDTNKIIDFKRFDEYNLYSVLQQNGIDCGVFVCNYIDCIITAKDFVETEGSFSFTTQDAYNYRFFEIAEKIKLISDSESTSK